MLAHGTHTGIPHLQLQHTQRQDMILQNMNVFKIKKLLYQVPVMAWEVVLRTPTGLRNCGLGSPARTGIRPYGQLADGAGLCLRPGGGHKPEKTAPLQVKPLGS